MRSLRFSVLHLTFVVAALPLAAGCRRSEAEPPPQGKPEAAAPIAVKQTEAQPLKVPRVLTLSGSLIGSEEAKVAAGAAGKVLSTYVERGSVVRKGAVLVKLDARALGAQAQEAAAQVESAKAQEGAGQARLRAHRDDVPEGQPSRRPTTTRPMVGLASRRPAVVGLGGQQAR